MLNCRLVNRPMTVGTFARLTWVRILGMPERNSRNRRFRVFDSVLASSEKRKAPPAESQIASLPPEYATSAASPAKPFLRGGGTKRRMKSSSKARLEMSRCHPDDPGPNRAALLLLLPALPPSLTEHAILLSHRKFDADGKNGSSPEQKDLHRRGERRRWRKESANKGRKRRTSSVSRRSGAATGRG